MNTKNKKNNDFLFNSKANVLHSLKKKIKKSKIEELFFFSVADWNSNNKKYLEYIYSHFTSNIIIRSSSYGEDSIEKSQAGKFLSILNVNPKSKLETSNAIKRVIKSYGINKFLESKNQVLIQSQTQNVLVSGVVFTKTLENGSPYYVINFEVDGSTDSVTKGSVSKTLKIFNLTKKHFLSSQWKKLIYSIEEIQSITNSEKLDIEFAITKNKIIIFQVRPLTSLKNNVDTSITKFVNNEIKKNRKKFLNLKEKNSIVNNKIIFSNMTDWNPAEIIGNRPRTFDYSLYNYLLLNDSWTKGRQLLDYAKPPNNSLMENFSGYPYINVQTSFNSFFPSSMPIKLRKKLMNYFLKKLENNPHLHDKSEFQILFTCYDFSLNKRIKELKNFGFTNKEIIEIKKILKNFTNQLISKTPELLSITENSLKILDQKRVQSQIQNTNYKAKLQNAELLLRDCKQFGAIPFSAIARLAFVSNILLKSLSETGKIEKLDVDNLLNSISSPVVEFQRDLFKLKSNKMSKQNFLNTYGHLRPGTYDPTIKRYDQIPDFLKNLTLLKIKRPIKKINTIKKSVINEIIQKHGLKFNEINFFDFINKTISLREKTKFEFTKSLSDVIEFILSAGRDLGFTANEMSFLSISDILKYKTMKRNELKIFWKKQIFYNKKFYTLNNYIQLPPIIFSQNDFNIVHQYVEKPNYITNKKIIDDTVILENLDDISNIDSKIVIIENADPGFDWIFTKNPAGLITKYGGIASHMAIRCAELGLPAAIGCGEKIFNQLRTSKKITLDCKNNDILILEYAQKNDFSEERKILKSLGYIK
tara:strand:- start:2626 stop:5067 length:2442 start_codon:yes stop_codon:yes gene_type:complete